MATPIGHSLAGYALSRFAPLKRNRSRLHLAALCAIMANLPDVDFLPGLLVGTPALYHQGPTHSLAFALLVSLLSAWLLTLPRERANLSGRAVPLPNPPGSTAGSFPVLFGLCLFSYGSHLLIDSLGWDRAAPYGLPLLWPLSEERFISPVPIFPGVYHAHEASDSFLSWVEQLFVLHNLWAILVEIALIAPFVLLGLWYERRTAGSAE